MIDEQVEDFLEHFGVKGMRWGVRRSSSKSGGSKARTPAEEQRRAERNKNLKKAALAGAVAVGAFAASRVIAKHGTKGLNPLNAFNRMGEDLMKGILTTKGNTPTKSIPKMSPEMAKRFASQRQEFAKLSSQGKSLTKGANADLKRLYEMNNRPFPQRKYI